MRRLSRENQRIERLEVPKIVTCIGERAFYGCSALKRVSLPGTLEKLGKGCFAECPTLQEVYIPSSLRRLPEAVFQSDVELKNIHFIKESQLIFKDANAFQGCKKLEHIEIP